MAGINILSKPFLGGEAFYEKQLLQVGE